MNHIYRIEGASCVLLALVALGACYPAVQAQELPDIVNYRELSTKLATAGQPSSAQFAALRDAGFERVINLAFSGDRNAVANEDRLVRELGMEYIHIPVVWTSPTASDFEHFAAIMEQAPDKKTLLHCQLNMRASAFAFVYRVLYEDVPIATARAAMNEIWEPDDAWRELIDELLAARDSSPP